MLVRSGRATKACLLDFIGRGSSDVNAVVAEGHATPEALVHFETGRPQRAVAHQVHPTCLKGSMHLTVGSGEILDVRAVALLDKRL